MKVVVACFFRGVFYSSLAALIVSCGSDMSSSDKKSATIPIANTIPAGSIPIPTQNGTIPIGYAADPGLFTRSVASVPHGVECIDALTNAGHPASAINIANYKAVSASRSGHIVLNDYQASSQIVMTVIDLSSYASAVDIRLMNPNAFYCLYSSKALNSSVTVQRICSAKMVTVFSETTQGGPAPMCFPFFNFWNRDTRSEGTMINGDGFTELPCVQTSI